MVDGKSHRPLKETTRDGVKTGGSASSSSRDDAGRTTLEAGFVIALSDCQVSSRESETGGSASSSLKDDAGRGIILSLIGVG